MMAATSPAPNLFYRKGRSTKKSIKCPCGWSVTAEDDEELIRQVQQHAKEVHDQNPSREKVLVLAQPEEGPSVEGWA